MATWKKQSGQEIELNDEKATVEKAKELGWEQIGASKSEFSDKPAAELKELMAAAGVEYTNKKEAVAYLEANK